MSRYIFCLSIFLLICPLACIENDSIEASDIELARCIETSKEAKQSDQTYLDYHTNLILWKCHDISEYKFRIFNAGMVRFFKSMVITVRSGEVVDVEVEEPEPYFDIERYSQIPTIDLYFEIIEQAVDPQIPLEAWLAEEKEVQVADDIRSEYDSFYGFPVMVYIDYHEGWADEERLIIIEDFEIL